MVGASFRIYWGYPDVLWVRQNRDVAVWPVDRVGFLCLGGIRRGRRFLRILCDRPFLPQGSCTRCGGWRPATASLRASLRRQASISRLTLHGPPPLHSMFSQAAGWPRTFGCDQGNLLARFRSEGFEA